MNSLLESQKPTGILKDLRLYDLNFTLNKFVFHCMLTSESHPYHQTFRSTDRRIIYKFIGVARPDITLEQIYQYFIGNEKGREWFQWMYKAENQLSSFADASSSMFKSPLIRQFYQEMKKQLIKPDGMSQTHQNLPENHKYLSQRERIYNQIAVQNLQKVAILNISTRIQRVKTTLAYFRGNLMKDQHGSFYGVLPYEKQIPFISMEEYILKHQGIWIQERLHYFGSKLISELLDYQQKMQSTYPSAQLKHMLISSTSPGLHALPAIYDALGLATTPLSHECKLITALPPTPFSQEPQRLVFGCPYAIQQRSNRIKNAREGNLVVMVVLLFNYLLTRQHPFHNKLTKIDIKNGIIKVIDQILGVNQQEQIIAFHPYLESKIRCISQFSAGLLPSLLNLAFFFNGSNEPASLNSTYIDNPMSTQEIDPKLIKNYLLNHRFTYLKLMIERPYKTLLTTNECVKRFEFAVNVPNSIKYLIMFFTAKIVSLTYELILLRNYCIPDDMRKILIQQILKEYPQIEKGQNRCKHKIQEYEKKPSTGNYDALKKSWACVKCFKNLSQIKLGQFYLDTQNEIDDIIKDVQTKMTDAYLHLMTLFQKLIQAENQEKDHFLKKTKLMLEMIRYTDEEVHAELKVVWDFLFQDKEDQGWRDRMLRASLQKAKIIENYQKYKIN